MAIYIDGKWIEQNPTDNTGGAPEDDMSNTGSDDDSGSDGGNEDGENASEADQDVGADDGDAGGDGDSGDTGNADGDDTKGDDAKPREQTIDERARQAEGRRRREAAAAEAQRIAAAEIAAVLSALGLQDDDGAPITSPEQALAYAEKKRVEKLNANLRAGELTVEDIKTLRGEQQIPGPAATAQVPAEPPVDIAAAIAEQLTRISREFNADIKSVDDILAMDTAETFRALVQAGRKDFYEAYKLANAEAIAEAKAAAKLRQQQQSAASKAHLQGSRGKAGDALLTPPKDVVSTFREFYPEATNDEIARVYTARVRAAQTAKRKTG
jgi:predicted transglutaminase-like cysteine proteinase